MNKNLDIYKLIEAIIKNREDASKFLSNNPDWLESKTSLGETSLHYLIIENLLLEAQWLIEKGANINTRDNFDNTPLIHASQLDYNEMVKLLISKGAQVDCQNNLSETAIFIAARNGYTEIVDLLLNAGANPLISDGINCISDVLPTEKQNELFKVLKKYGYEFLPRIS